MKYDRNKQYRWNPDELFTITGKELGLISYTMKLILSTETAAQVLLANKVNDVVEKLIEKGVENGVMTEIPNDDEKQKETPEES